MNIVPIALSSLMLLTGCVKETKATQPPVIQETEIQKPATKQNQAPLSIQLPCDWKANQVHRYSVTEQRFENNSDSLKRESKSSIEIKTISENPLVITWSQQVDKITISSTATPAEQRQKKLSEAIQKKLKGLSLKKE